MHKFVRNLITEWRKLGLPLSGETIIVAVSGGADSLSLLLAVDDLQSRRKIDLRIVAAHFNHDLRGRASDADEEFLKNLASEKDFELAIGHGSISKKGNLEQNARDARYRFLTQTAENLKAYCVLTAHTMDDQAETFLLNLIRGSGIKGLSGMAVTRELNQTSSEHLEKDIENDEDRCKEEPFLPFVVEPKLIRPLLTWARRADTENFCQECGVEFRYDTMNEDLSFKRVRVRKILLPVLTDLNPKIVETLSRTAGLMRLSNPPDQENIEANATNQLWNSTSPDLKINDLRTLERPLIYERLRQWLKLQRGSLRSISSKHVESIERLMLSKKSGQFVELPGRGIIRKRGGSLAYTNIKVDK